MNSVNLIGNLTCYPELRYTTSNKAVCTFSIAVNRSKDEVDYFDVQCWDKTAEASANMYQKGTKVAISGALKQDRWTDKETGKGRSRVIINAFSTQGLANMIPREQPAIAPATAPNQTQQIPAPTQGTIPYENQF